MKEVIMEKEVMFRGSLYAFLLCLVGGLVQITAAEFSTVTAVTGSAFFVLAAVFAVVIGKLSIVARRPRKQHVADCQ